MSKAFSKKGFTLVELVVVIAILAILAAIAIPAVISIINSASETSADSDATTMTLVCRAYYAGVKSGAINSSNFKPEKCSDEIPEKNTAFSLRAAAAYKCTLAGALEYDGIYDKVISEITDFGYDSGGKIIYIGTMTDEEKEGITQIEDPSTVTFSDMNYKV